MEGFKKKICSVVKNDFVPILVFAGIGLLVFLKGEKFDIKTSGDFILFITFLGLIWYSYETRKTRISSEEQTDLLLTPVVEFKIEENKGASYCFKLRNVGAGLASNIQIVKNTVICRNKIYEIEDKDTYKAPEFEIPNFLSSGQEEILKPRQKGEDILWIIKPEDVMNPGTVEIKYQNLKGKDFFKKFKIIKRCSDEKGWTYYEMKAVQIK